MDWDGLGWYLIGTIDYDDELIHNYYQVLDLST